MADNRRYYRKTMVAEVGSQLVDVTLLALARYHSATQQEQDDLLHLLSIDTRHNQLELLLPHFGTCQPIQAETIAINRWPIDGEFDRMATLTATMTLTKTGPWWTEGGLLQTVNTLPASMVSSLDGEPLGKLIDHPYLPGDMIIKKMTGNEQGWAVQFHD